MNETTANSPTDRIALYGGSFDPVHTAHLEVARAARDYLELDRVLFLPAANSPLKKNKMQTDGSARLEMLRLAIAEEPRFTVDAREIERGGTSYTVDTVRSIRADFPDAQLYWILGGDQFELLPDWYQIEELAAMLSFAVLQRPGYSLKEPQIPALKYVTIPAPLMEQSSSQIRERLAAGESVGEWLPPSVGAFILQHQLYTR